MVNDYDIILPELNLFNNIDYFLFTDNSKLEINPYKNIVINPDFNNHSLTNRSIKVRIPEILKKYDITIYIDSNISIIGDIRTLIDEFLSSNSELGVFTHPYSQTLKQEVELCISKKKCNITKINKEMEYYKSLLVPEDSKVSDNSIIFRRKHNHKMNIAMSHWLKLVCEYSGRDQVSLPAIRFLYKLNTHFFTFSPRTFGNKYFVKFPHKIAWDTSSIINKVLFAREYLIKSFIRYLIFLKNILY